MAAEQAVIDRAYARLDALREQARAVSSGVLSAGSGGTHQARYERDVRVQATARRLAELADADSGLCFGRIDRQAGDRYYIGRAAIADEDNEPLVVDWRAPAAEPFYRATGRDPMGLTRRRHFLLRGRRLVGIEDDLLVAGGDEEAGGTGPRLVLVGEAALIATLESGRTGRMSDIVATIQREQDEIIRSPLPGLLVVQGGPGTGKTAIALHRAAYLLYTHRFPLERGGVLLVGPNKVFLRYIERVLPSLGEHTVVFSTPASLLHAATVSAVDPPAIAALKGDSRMAGFIARAVLQRERPLIRTVALLAGHQRLTLTPGASRRIVDSARRRRGTHNERRASMERQVMRHLRRQWVRKADPDDPDAEWPPLARRLRHEPSLVEALERMWPILTPAAFLHDLFGFPALIRDAAAGELDEPELSLLHRPRRRRLGEVRWTEGDIALLDEAAALLGPLPRRTRVADRPGDGDEWLAERAVDDAGELDEVMRSDLLQHLARWSEAADEELPDPASRTFSHVVVDEAQDLSPMQLRMLARRCPSGSMTIVGDLGQASRPWAPRTWDDVIGHLHNAWGRGLAPHRRPPRLVELTVNYRTPAEVMELAARVLRVATPGVEPPTPARHSGNAPLITAVGNGTDIVEAAAAAARDELAAIGEGRVGVIAPEVLVEPLRARLGGPSMSPSERDLLDAEVAVLPLDLAKGLEFDSVVVVEPAMLVDERTAGLRALYIALTRTTRRLHLVHQQDLPASLRQPVAVASGAASRAPGL